MSKSKVNIQVGLTLEEREKARYQRFKNLSPSVKMQELCRLIELSIILESRQKKEPVNRNQLILKRKG